MVGYGISPAPDEIEISLFGPGYGEAIAVHLGGGQWMLVDSCIPIKGGRPASLEYLESIKVPFTAVKVVVASHWHDDHVDGMFEVVRACSDAVFFYSQLFSNREALAFLAAYGDKDNAPQSNGMRQLFSIIKMAPNPRVPTAIRTEVIATRIQGKEVKVVAFSPTADAVEYSLARMAEYVAKEHEPINHAPELKPNVESVVLHVDFGTEAMLLGADLEDYKKLGWSGILGDSWCLAKQKGSLYKIAHHGSKTAGSNDIWNNLLQKKRVSGLTPFNLGRVQLPTTQDKKRIRSVCEASFTTSTASRKPAIDRDLLRKMSRICNVMAKVNPGFGALRFRKRFQGTSWSVEQFGRAGKL